MPVDPALPPSLDPDARNAERVAALERRAGAAERAQLETHIYYGPRTDLAGGWGERVRSGKLSDGSYGIERWTEAGQRQLPTWSNA